jgi:uncharacterized membrane protein YgcG
MRYRARQVGFILLEVVVAVGLLVLGMAVIGAQIQTSAVRARETDRQARVTFLAESKFAEIDTGLVIPDEDEIEEDFGRLFPAYAWRLRFEPTGEQAADSVNNFDNLGLAFIQLEILHDPRRDPDETFDFDGATVVGEYYTLRAAPRPLDLTLDFGMEDDVAEKLNEDLAGLAGDLDVHNFNPALFKDLDKEEILKVLPVLMQAFGMRESDILNLVPADLRPQLEAIFDMQNTDEDLEESGDGDTGGGETGGEETGNGRGDGDGAGQADDDEESRGRGARGGRPAGGGRRSSGGSGGGGASGERGGGTR